MKSEAIASGAAAAPLQRNLLLQSLEQVMLAISGTGDEFFRNLVKNLAKAAQAKHALIGEIKKDAPDTVRTLAVWSGEGYFDNFEYGLSGTPCANVMQQRVCYYPSGIQESFPQDLLLAQMGVHTYLGVPLVDRLGRGTGLLVLLNAGPLPEPEVARLLLEICSAKATAELDRHSQGSEDERSRETVQWMLDNFGLVLDCIHDHAVFRLDLEGRVLGWNPGAARMYGYTDPEVVGKSLQMFWRQPEQVSDFLEQARSSGQAEIPVQQSHKTGKMFPAHVFLRQTFGRDGTPRGFVFIARNLIYPMLLEHGRQIVQMLAFREPPQRVLEYLTRLLQTIFPDARAAIMLLS